MDEKTCGKEDLLSLNLFRKLQPQIAYLIGLQMFSLHIVKRSNHRGIDIRHDESLLFTKNIQLTDRTHKHDLAACSLSFSQNFAI